MALKDRLLNLDGAPTTRPCVMAELIDSLPPDDAEVLTRVLAGRTSTRKIHQELTAEGYRISRDTIGYHRNGWCRCPKGDEA